MDDWAQLHHGIETIASLSLTNSFSAYHNTYYIPLITE